jgi:hypothetical protein
MDKMDHLMAEKSEKNNKGIQKDLKGAVNQKRLKNTGLEEAP